MAHREAAARRTLPKCGIEVVDSEAVAMQACLARIQDTLAADAREKSKARAVTRVVPTPAAQAGRNLGTSLGREDTVDVSARTEMGTARETSFADTDEHEALAERTDAIVAQASLLRLMGTVSRLASTVEGAVEDAAKAKARAAELEATVARLEATVAEQAAKLRAHDDADAAFKRYRELWEQKVAKERQAVAADAEVRRQLIATVLEKRAANIAARRLVRDRRKVLNSRLAAAAAEPDAAKHDAEIEAMLKGFAPLPATVEADAQGAVPQFALKSLQEGRGLRGFHGSMSLRTPMSTSHAGTLSLGTRLMGLPSGSSAAVTPAAASLKPASEFGTLVSSPTVAMQQPGRRGSGDATPAQAATNQPTPADTPGAQTPAAEALDGVSAIKKDPKSASQQLRLLDKLDAVLESDGTNLDFLDDDDTSTASETGDDPEDKPKQKKNKKKKTGDENEVRADELVITRFLGSSARQVARMDPTATYIGVLLNALRYAPSEYTILVLDPDALVGRRPALARQAAAAGIASFWEEVASCSAPVVYIAQCNPTSSNAAPTAPSGEALPPDPDASHVVTLTERYAEAHFQRQKTFKEPDDELERRAVHAYRANPAVRKPLQLTAANAERLEVRAQPPGIVAVLGRGAVAGERIDLISAGMVRCYTSTMAPACKVDALISPFFDLHSPYFATRDGPGQWVSIVFDKIAITPTAYSFACTHPTAGGSYPRSWALEGSLDGDSWTLLRRHAADETLNRYRPVAVWPVQATPGTYFSHFRIRQEGPNAVSTRELNLCSFEVYGRAMYVRERQIVNVEHRPPLPMSHSTLPPERSLTASAGASPTDEAEKKQQGPVPRRLLRFRLFDDLPPEPAPAKKGKKGAKKK